jgi:hypothetical protein
VRGEAVGLSENCARKGPDSEPGHSAVERPIGVTTLEDKIVQGALAAVLSAIYDLDFMGLSYGWVPARPKPASGARGATHGVDDTASKLDS